MSISIAVNNIVKSEISKFHESLQKEKKFKLLKLE